MFSIERCEIYSKRYFKDFLKKGSFGQFLMNQKKAIFLLLVSFYGFSASAEQGHIPKKMPVANAELDNLFDNPEYAQVQSTLIAELLGWILRTEDPLPHPPRRYQFKSDRRNYWSPHR